MKNISRRVFIKGMAVAAVATAASSVLAGCNFVPGNETTEVPVDTTTKTIVLTPDSDEKNETLTIIIKGLSVDALTGYAVVPVEFVNKLGTNCTLTSTAAANKLALAAYVDNDTAKVVFVKDDVPGVAADTMLVFDDSIVVPDVSGNVTGTFAGKIYFDMSKQKDWKSLQLVFNLNNGATGTVVTLNK